MGQHDEGQRKEAVHHAIGEIEKAQRGPFGDDGQEHASNHAGDDCARSSGQAHHPRGDMEVAAEASQNGVLKNGCLFVVFLW